MTTKGKTYDGKVSPSAAVCSAMMQSCHRSGVAAQEGGQHCHLGQAARGRGSALAPPSSICVACLLAPSAAAPTASVGSPTYAHATLFVALRTVPLLAGGWMRVATRRPAMLCCHVTHVNASS